MSAIAKAFLDFIASDLFAVIFICSLVVMVGLFMAICLDDMGRR